MRKLIGMFGILIYIIGYAAMAITLGELVTGNWLQLGYYIIAGIIWVFPLKPIFAWMHADSKAD